MKNRPSEELSKEKMESIMQGIGSTISDAQMFRIIHYYMLTNGFKHIDCDTKIGDTTVGLEYNCVPFNFAERHKIINMLREGGEKDGGSDTGEH